MRTVTSKPPGGQPRAGKPGAPAKPASEKYQAVTLRLHPAAVKQLRRLAKRLKLSQGQTVTKALESLETEGAKR